MRKKFRTIGAIRGPVLIAERMEEARLGDLVRIAGERNGKVLALEKGVAVIQVFEQTDGLSMDTSIELMGRPYETHVSEDVLGRIFDGFGRPLDRGHPLVGGEKRSIDGMPINPEKRTHPERFIETGISVIDMLNSLVGGQKLPIFSMSGLPHNELAAQVITESKMKDLVVLFCGLGLTYDDYEFFRLNAVSEKTRDRTAMFMNLATDPTIERLITPRLALTHAEYLAFEKGHNVLVVLSDMRNYCDALREVSSAKREMPGRGGYPTYMYSDLASIYERAGIIKGRKGSLTQLTILTMPNDDITHPIPDLTGYTTEGQIVMDRELFVKGIYPPVNILPSLSRLMGGAVGEGKTRSDHREVMDQIYSFYSEGIGVRRLASVIGEEALTGEEKKLLAFSEDFEKKILGQQSFERRTLEQSLNLAWEALSKFDSADLVQISEENMKKYYRSEKHDEA